MDSSISLPPYTINQIGDYQTLSQNVPWGISKLDVPSAWAKTKGEGITIMVIDTGFSGHEDNVNETKGPSFVAQEPDSRDYNGHGTHVVGIIGACDNATGIVGVAPNSKIISVKALDKNGFATGASVERALEYAAKVKPDIINLSLGSSKTMPDSIYNLLQKMADQGIVTVVAAGNNGRKGGIMYPAKWPMTFAIGAYDIFDEVASFSAVGEEIDFVAPGVEILSTFLNNQYAIMSGTSMAAPFVTGVLALMLAQAKKIGVKYATAKQIYDHLLVATVDLGPKGFDNRYGFGVIVPSQVVHSVDGNNPAPATLPKHSRWKKFTIGVKSFFGWA